MTLIKKSAPVSVDGQDYSKEQLQQLAEAAETPAATAAQEQATLEGLRDGIAALKKGKIANLAPLLPLVFSLKGEPYRIREHFPFEPFFSTRLPQRITLQCGRQVSKCFVTGQTLYDEYGRRVKIEDVRVGDRVVSVSLPGFRTTAMTVVATHQLPAKPCVEVRTRLGGVLRMAVTHPVLKYEGWETAGRLRVGDRVAHVERSGRFGKFRADETRLRLTAYMLGDGSFRGTYSFTADRGTEAIKEVAELVYGDFRRYPKQEGLADDLRFRKEHPLYAWAKEDGLHGKLAHEKHIPDWVFRLSRKQTATFIERLWSTDGSCTAGPSESPSLTFSSTSRELAYGLKSLLLKFGVLAAIKKRPTGYKKSNGKKKTRRPAYVVRVETRRSWERFAEAFTVPDKPFPGIPPTVSNNNRDTTPREVQELIYDLTGRKYGRRGMSLRQAGLRHTLKSPPTRQKLARYLEYFRQHAADHPRLPELERLVEGDVVWDEITAIKTIGEKDCYDIEVAGTHNYVADGLVTHNSTSLAAQGVIQSITIPFFNTLFITPLFETIRRFSSNYVRGFIEDSPVKSLLIDTSCNNSVLQRSFRNRSTLFFSYMLMDANRVRGINADRVGFDEAQDLDPDLVPIAQETLSGSKWGLSAFTGTPKTLDGFLARAWMRSSQAQWHIWCRACGYENIPAAEYDLEAMTGPSYVPRKISEKQPGIICAKCSRPVFPRTGRWVHHYPEHRHLSAGYHVPQQIMPMHYADPVKWATLLGKRETQAENIYLNEVCGESCDTGAKLVTQTELKRACMRRPNSLEYAEKHVGDYVHRVVAVDWGGQGQDEVSYTVAVCMGMLPDGRIDVLYGHRFHSMHDYGREAHGILQAMRMFKAPTLVHDFGGAGTIREYYLVQAGLPRQRICPVLYVRSSVGPLMKHVPPNDTTGQRDYYQVDKARSLLMNCELIRQRRQRFFEYDFIDPDRPGLIQDYLALTEDKIKSRSATDMYTIIRGATAGPDDFAQACNIGMCALFHVSNHWPDLAALAKIKLTEAEIQELSPSLPRWDDW